MRTLKVALTTTLLVFWMGCDSDSTEPATGDRDTSTDGATVDAEGDTTPTDGEIPDTEGDTTPTDGETPDTEEDTSGSDAEESDSGNADTVGDTSSTDSGSDGGMDTSDASSSCGQVNQPCCNPDAGTGCASGLKCCSGNPLPPGQTKCLSRCPISERTRKEEIQPIDRKRILERLSSLPIKKWKYKKRSTDREHIGPMVGDFRRTFGLGNSSEKYLSLIDAHGVTMAAMQQLYRKVEKLERENDRLREQLRTMGDSNPSTRRQCRPASSE